MMAPVTRRHERRKALSSWQACLAVLLLCATPALAQQAADPATQSAAYARARQLYYYGKYLRQPTAAMSPTMPARRCLIACTA